MRVLWELRQLLEKFGYMSSDDIHAIINLLGRFRQAKENTKGGIKFSEFVLSRYNNVEDF